MKITADEIKKVKADGFLHNRGTNYFSGRVITENGLMTSSQMVNLSEAAKRYGNGTMTFTSRLTIEIPAISYENIGDFKEYIAKKNMVTGGTGTRVRPIVACKGTTCIFGLYDTQELATEIHQRFYKGYYDVKLPHKFKIGVGGCPNNCIKPDLNDLGIVGQKVPIVNKDLCRNCKTCGVIKGCPMKAPSINDDKILIDTDICNNCGRCAKACPFKAVTENVTMYKIFIGGRWGKQIRIGTPLNKLFDREEAIAVIEKAILLFKSKGVAGERFGTTVERLGVEQVEMELISTELLDNKDKILEN